MNRRTYIKRTISLFCCGVLSVPLFKWLQINKPFDFTFLREKESLIAELVELIIPETVTVGAKRANVHHYVINVLSTCIDTRTANKFIAGLKNLEKKCLDEFDKDFLSCSSTEKSSLLEYYANNSVYSIGIVNKINNKFLGGSFFNTLKSLTVEGYCTSMLGATQGLSYEYIPGSYEACIPLHARQKSWATK